MSQGSLILPTTGTVSGLTLVQDINAALANEASCASGATDPATLAGGVQPFSFWADMSVTPNLLRQRNAGNTAWILIGDLTQANLGLASQTAFQQDLYSSAAAGGTADALTASFTPAITSTTLASGVTTVSVRATLANATATPTFTPNSGTVAPAAIVKGAGAALSPGDIAGAGHWITLQWDATLAKWVLLNPANGVNGSAAPSVRQTVLGGVTNSSGYANMLSAGSGLALNLAATATPMRAAFAQGALDYIATLSADVTGVLSVPANNLSFITQDYLTPTSVTWGSTLAPRQEGNTYNQAAQSVLQFGGAAGATTFLDDFGNTWTAQGGAKVQTNQIKFGTGALGGGGTSNALNGTTDFIKSSSFTTLGNGGWTLRGYRYLTSNSTLQTFISAHNSAGSSGYGAQVYTSTSGKLLVYLSSTGSSYDMASAITGTTTLATGQMYSVELTFDPVAGKYFVYLNGVLEITITSSLKICGISEIRIGADLSGNFATGYIDKFEFLPYCQHPNGITYTPPIAAPNVATQGYASDWESKPNNTMYQVSGASTAAGVNPTFSAKNRVYVGEATAGATTISSVVNYALRGLYYNRISGIQAASSRTLQAHNIGSDRIKYTVNLVNKTAELGYIPGNRVPFLTNYAAGPVSYSPFQMLDRNTSAIATNTSSATIQQPASAPTTGTSATLANWDTEIIIEKAVN